MRRAVLVSVLVLALAAGCRKPQKRPSPEYAAAQARFVALYAEQLDEAYLLPEMEGLLAQLGRVPADSLDAQLAQQLCLAAAAGPDQQDQLAVEVADFADESFEFCEHFYLPNRDSHQQRRTIARESTDQYPPWRSASYPPP